MDRLIIGQSAFSATTIRLCMSGHLLIAGIGSGIFSGCSSPNQTETLTIRVTDADSNPIYNLANGDRRSVRVWVKDPNALPLGEVSIEIKPDGCIKVAESGLVLMSGSDVREDGELVHSVDMNVDQQCPSGTQASLLILARSHSGQRLVQGELNKRFTITPSGPRPVISVRDLRINGLSRRTVFAGETLRIGLNISNTGDAVAADFSLNVTIDDRAQSGPSLALTQSSTTSFGPGEFKQVDWDQPFVVPNEVEPGSELPIKLSWHANQGTLAGEWTGHLKVAPSPYPDRFLINGRSELHYLAGDELDVGFDLVNPSEIDIGPGHMWIESLTFAEVLQKMDEVKFSDLTVLGRSRIDGTLFRITPHVSSVNGVSMQVRWQSVYGYAGTFSIDLKSKEIFR